ncbi:hypothetical protein V494_00453 [Pseudogymnoascus sp. VKM F-4513 (FW-928)]|nr:hypothetical protein V494_00453 [Pseudogymnoascus sp. VKM F-4513 (FW-928)]
MQGGQIQQEGTAGGPSACSAVCYLVTFPWLGDSRYCLGEGLTTRSLGKPAWASARVPRLRGGMLKGFALGDDGMFSTDVDPPLIPGVRPEAVGVGAGDGDSRDLLYADAIDCFLKTLDCYISGGEFSFLVYNYRSRDFFGQERPPPE